MNTSDEKKITDIILDEKNVVKIQDATTLDLIWVKKMKTPVNYYYM